MKKSTNQPLQTVVYALRRSVDYLDRRLAALEGDAAIPQDPGESTEDLSPSEPSWKLPDSVGSWRVRVACRAPNVWNTQYSDNYSDWDWFTARSDSPTREDAQAKLDEYARYYGWIDLRMPKARRWRGDYGRVLFAHKIDLGDGNDHWVPVLEFANGVRLLASSLLSGSYSSRAYVESKLAHHVDLREITDEVEQ
jgi:hypothetical protein